MHNNEYFEWLCQIVTGDYSYRSDHRNLLWKLFDTEFSWVIENDASRAMDGLDLRDHFERYEHGYCDIDGRCRILEMMVALAHRCEESIMDDPNIGDRTWEWFWSMIKNLNLYSMDDKNFDRDYVEDILTKFLNREYEPDGTGGLFTITSRNDDLRNVEIWYQMMWHLDEVIGVK